MFHIHIKHCSFHYPNINFINYLHLHLLYQLMTSRDRGDYDSFTLQEVLIVYYT